MVTWENPSDIVYGTALGTEQLSATADISGTFSYYPGEGIILTAGANQKLTVTFTLDDSNYSGVKDTVTINVSRASLTIINAIVNDKIYDGTTDAVIIGAELSGLVDDDDVVLVNNNAGSFSRSGVESDIPVTMNMSVEGNDISNYTFPEFISLSGNIVAKTLTVGGTFSAADKAYDGNTSATISENSLFLVNIIDNDVVILESMAEFVGPDAADDILVSLTDGSYLTGDDSYNYTLSLEGAPTTTADIIQYFNISAFAGSNGSIDPSGSISVKNGNTQIFTITPDDGYEISNVLVDGSVVGSVNIFTFSDISDNHTIEVTFDIKTEIAKTDNTVISIYPNPTSDEFHILNASGCNMKLLSLQGTVLITKSIDSDDESVCLSPFPAGYYILVLKDRIFKVIKK